MHTQNINVYGATEASRICEKAKLHPKWVSDLYLFTTQEMGQFCVKYTSQSTLGNFTTFQQCAVFAKNRLDAAFKFGRLAVKESRFDVYAVDVLVPIQDVCISTTGYHFINESGQWRCIETEQTVNVVQNGDVWNEEQQDLLALYGQLVPKI